MTALPENVRLPREVVQLAWEQYPARTALITAHQTLSYAQLRDRVLVLATNFSRMGLSSGDVCYANWEPRRKVSWRVWQRRVAALSS